MLVDKYTTTQNIALFEILFLKESILYIEEYDPVEGKPQRVFDSKSEYLGTISCDRFFEVKKYLLIIKE